jgi:hypothetical protein
LCDRKIAGNAVVGQPSLRLEQERLTLQAQDDTSLLLMGGAPIAEPIVASGPFVMNTEQEIRLAMMDYQSGVWDNCSVSGGLADERFIQQNLTTLRSSVRILKVRQAAMFSIHSDAGSQGAIQLRVQTCLPPVPSITTSGGAWKWLKSASVSDVALADQSVSTSRRDDVGCSYRC